MNKMIFAGYGGQGMLLAGQLLAYAAMLEDQHVTWLPSYGPEMRGGAASCSVIVSKQPVGSPVIQFADAVIAMNQPSFDKFLPSVKKDGLILYNTSMVNPDKTRQDVQYMGIDVTRIAMDLNNIKVANMVVLGSLNEALHCVRNESIINALKEKFGEAKANLIKINEQAIEKGTAVIREQLYVK